MGFCHMEDYVVDLPAGACAQDPPHIIQEEPQLFLGHAYLMGRIPNPEAVRWPLER